MYQKVRNYYYLINKLIFSGIGYIRKEGKNRIKWVKDDYFKMKGWETNKEQIKLDEKNENRLKYIDTEIKKVEGFIKKMSKNLNSFSNSRNYEKNNFLTYEDICKLSSENNRQLIAVKSINKIKTEIKSLEDNKQNFTENFFEFIENNNSNQKNRGDINKKSREILELNNYNNIVMLESLGQPKSIIDLYFIEKNYQNHKLNDSDDNSEKVYDPKEYLNELKCRKCSFNSNFSILSFNSSFN